MHAPPVASELQPLLVELTDLAFSAKQAHWNVVGPFLRPLHLQLDELFDDLRTWSDRIAERMVALGTPADARIEVVAAQTPLPSLAAGFLEYRKALSAIVARIDDVISRIRPRIERLGERDLVTQDMVIQITAGLEKHAWMFAEQQS